MAMITDQHGTLYDQHETLYRRCYWQLVTVLVGIIDNCRLLAADCSGRRSSGNYILRSTTKNIFTIIYRSCIESCCKLDSTPDVSVATVDVGRWTNKFWCLVSSSKTTWNCSVSTSTEATTAATTIAYVTETATACSFTWNLSRC